ncbi:LLM class F420-dependent oxidoreductase [Acidiferrimicrobium sp. IK]|uniref:LLM class F420-dependent oxidoreductase n=1 Tax=Acidiferrimicrobium sp. IK TaxID=2871700 RepID=UPI0021CB058D|nr:LLM class F420-dependent oxidoreductase [Acidiferrimicrobium sp. IK]MCU4187155.1 LLM class F420-dependent oxidoreductase [Acidiferrimicrobium sp. IK]
MTSYGYTMMCEQSAPKALVTDLVAAEAAGFDFSVISDHYSPWLDAQGHAPYAWSVLGAAAQATERIGLMTYVTCPTRRYHPAVVAQKAATMALLSDGRFRLGLGAGENLNEHVIGGGWPPANTRHEMLDEALQIITALFAGGYVNFRGAHFQVDSAKLWDLPDRAPEIGVAVSGEQSVELAARYADYLIAVEPEADLVEGFNAKGGQGKDKVGQIPVCFDPDKKAAVARAHEQFRWFAGGWKVNAEMPGTSGFAAATQFVTPDDVAENIPCGSDVEEFVGPIQAFAKAGFTHVALVQIGGDHQAAYIDWAQKELLPALRG